MLRDCESLRYIESRTFIEVEMKGAEWNGELQPIQDHVDQSRTGLDECHRLTEQNRKKRLSFSLRESINSSSHRQTRPFLKRRLREDAEEFIVESATALPRKAAAKLVVFLPEDEVIEAATVADAVHQHFACRRVEAEKELSRTLVWGWRSLLIGLVFLSLVIALAEGIRRFLPPGNFSSVIQVGLSILAWVALWRPGELLLYEWYPFRRDTRIFRKLEQAEIELGIRAKDVN